ncbi:MAG: 16S rRNA (cytosine(967)-C(5))-methyltransferase RsmB [Lysobacteraceae bacterium]|nr:MAG: 16S rRNA (cytosine(967)-C(5))-methyltransferase RsmB [Xanthomonadaceae bacterium]
MNTTPSGVASRLAAARVLDAVLHRGRSLKGEFANTLPKLEDPRDRALVEAICFAALRERARYAAALEAWIAKPLGRRDEPLRALLYAGFAQVDALKLPAHAAVDATVEAARALGRAHQAGMVNALLRRVLREGLPQAGPAQTWPQWLLDELRRDWPQHAETILAASAAPAPLWLRVNRARMDRDAYRRRLLEAGIEAVTHPLCADALRIDGSLSIAELPGFDEGWVSVQDASAQMVADLFAPAPGMHMLDACVAPGGKAAHLLEREPGLQLTAIEIDPRRLRRTVETLARLGVDAQATLKAADAVDLAAWWDGRPFDTVLIDAPCSATGIVRRQPDVLLHRREGDIDALVATQGRLLDALWATLASDGWLVYATCSILARENAQQIDAFLARTPDAVAEPLSEGFGHAAGAGRQRLPGEEGMDGFFYARLREQG